MNLDLFKDLIKSTKENDIVQSFIKELSDCLENNLNNNKKNQIIRTDHCFEYKSILICDIKVR